MIPISFIARRDRTLHGHPFPGEMLTYPRPGQWYVGDEPVPGASGASYVVGIRDIGKTIRCGASLPVRIWHPKDVSQVEACWLAWTGPLNGIGPDTPAADGDTVRRWRDLINEHDADQTTGVSQPIYRAHGAGVGLPTVEFDGIDDGLLLSGVSLNIYRNVLVRGVVASVRDTLPAGGQSEHTYYYRSVSSAAGVSFAARTRNNNMSQAGTQARAADNSNIVNVTSPSSGGYAVLSHISNGVTGQVSVQSDDETVASAAIDAVRSSDTAAQGAAIGKSHHNAFPFPGHVACLIVYQGDDLPSTQDLNRLRQYAGLLVGKNLGLPIT